QGTIDLQGDSRLRFDQNLPPRDLTIEKGAQLLGTGTLLMSGANRVVMDGDATAIFKIVLQDSARSTGAGTLSLVGSQTLTGTYDSPVRIEKDSVSVGIGAMFNNLLTIANGGTLFVAENQGITINGKVSNQGRLALPSRDRVSTISGTGFIDNAGLIEIYP